MPVEVLNDMCHVCMYASAGPALGGVTPGPRPGDDARIGDRRAAVHPSSPDADTADVPAPRNPIRINF